MKYSISTTCNMCTFSYLRQFPQTLPRSSSHLQPSHWQSQLRQVDGALTTTSVLEIVPPLFLTLSFAVDFDGFLFKPSENEISWATPSSGSNKNTLKAQKQSSLIFILFTNKEFLPQSNNVDVYFFDVHSLITASFLISLFYNSILSIVARRQKEGCNFLEKIVASNLLI